MSKRFKRLLPAHVFVLFLLLLVFIKYFWPFNFLRILANVFFLDQFLPGVQAINFVSWSLSYELVFYVGMGLWVTAGRRWNFLNSWPVWLILVAVIHSSQWLLPHYLGNPLKYLDTSRWVGFFWGVLLARLYFSEKKIWSKIKELPVKLAFPAVFVILALQVIWSQPGQAVWLFEHRVTLNFYYGVLHLAFAILVAAMLSDRMHPLKKLFSLQPVRWLGLISYSFYLIHATLAIPISAYFLKWVPHVFSKMILHYGVAFVLTMIFAGISYHFFERPYFSHKTVK